MPSSAYAQARGLVNAADRRQRGVEEVAAEALPSRDRRERPTTVPSAQSARPWLSSEPHSSSHRREYDMKFRKRPRSALNAWLTKAR